jgi:Rrf2 family protein
LLSQTTEYALRAVLHIASQPDGTPVRANALASAIGVPQNYLSKTLHQLARAGILTSTRGPTGGFQLAVPATWAPIATALQTFFGTTTVADLTRTPVPNEVTTP